MAFASGSDASIGRLGDSVRRGRIGAGAEAGVLGSDAYALSVECDVNGDMSASPLKDGAGVSGELYGLPVPKCSGESVYPSSPARAYRGIAR
jgi:hypothetical protein